jgi:acetyl-CoA carboxylase alpha subunit
VDEVIREPIEGAQTDPAAAVELLASALKRHLSDLKSMTVGDLVAARQRKFRNIAQFYSEE